MRYPDSLEIHELSKSQYSATYILRNIHNKAKGKLHIPMKFISTATLDDMKGYYPRPEG